MEGDRIFNWRVGELDISEPIFFQDEEERHRAGTKVNADWRFSDYIFEAHTVQLQREYTSWLEREDSFQWEKEGVLSILKRVFDADIKMQICIELTRMHIFNVDNLSLQFDYEHDDDIVEQICRLLDKLGVIEDYTGNTLNDEMVYEDLLGELRGLAEYFSGAILESVFDNIIHYVERIHNLEDITPRELGIYRNEIYKLANRIPDLYSKRSKKRYRTLRKLYNRCFANQENMLLTFQKMSISYNRFRDEIEGIIGSVVDEVQMIQQNSISFDEVFNEDYRDKLYEIEEYLKKQLTKPLSKDEKKRIKKYTNGGGCFGVMECKKEAYFALSAKDDYVDTSWRGILVLNPEIKKLADAINQEVFNNQLIWAGMTDDTRRYTELVYDNDDIEIIPGYSNLGKDMGKTTDDDLIGRTYGCCERKMQAAAGHDFNSDKSFYARWSPCDKCVPGLICENGLIRIFAIAKDYREWKDSRGENDKWDIQEYQIQRNMRRVR